MGNETMADKQNLLHYQGQLVYLHMHGKERTLFNLDRPSMRNLFVDDCMYGINSGFFDGCFIDRANWAQQELHRDKHPIPHASLEKLATGGPQLFTELQAAATSRNIILSKETNNIVPMDWKEANSMMLTDSYCSGYNPKEYTAEQCEIDITALQAAAARG